MEDLVPAEEDAQQGVEPREVVHMRMRHERMAHPQELPRRERMQIAEIEEQSPAVEQEIDVQPRIAEGIVDQPGMEERLHAEASILWTRRGAGL